MSPGTEAVLSSWSLVPPVVLSLGVAGILYGRGWFYLRHFNPVRWSRGPLLNFYGGMLTVFLAICSPIDPLGYFLVSAHMLQHVLLMFLAPPLLLLGKPYLPMLAGLPAPIRKNWITPFLRHRAVRAVASWLIKPVPAWIIFVLATWIWHIPALYDLAIRIPVVHYLEHAFFFGTGVLFWWPVIQPYPGGSVSRYALIPYLFLAGVQGTALSGILTFADHVIYPHYRGVPRISALSPLDDQALAGAIMWVPGSIAYLIPLSWIVYRILTGAESATAEAGDSSSRTPVRRRRRKRRRPDLLHLKGVGRFLGWRYARPVLQIPLLLVAALVIFDGLTGPQVTPLNLAGVVPWIYWRGLIVLGLLFAMNFFCMSCPFMLPRKLAKILFGSQRPWPRVLRSKWLSCGLLLVFFWAYEAFSLWDSPWLTAWIALAYFITAFVVDAVFRDASFCKYVCPAGQFQMVQSLASPMEVRVRDAEVCRECRTKDCIRGRDNIPGCELHLFLPRKAGNLDCVFCLDCVHACPYDNVGIAGAVAGRELWRDAQRSGIGRFRKRIDIAALVLILVFAAYANAGGMIAPTMVLRDDVARSLGPSWMPLVLAGAFLLALVVIPLLCAGLAAGMTRVLAGERESLRDIAGRYAYALLPVGAAMWVAHYSFHLFTSADALFPAVRRFVDSSASSMMMSSMSLPKAAGAGLLLRWEILCLDIGLLLSLYVTYRIGLNRENSVGRGLLAAAPWGLLSVALHVLGVWILFQPMQMRGMMPHGG